PWCWRSGSPRSWAWSSGCFPPSRPRSWIPSRRCDMNESRGRMDRARTFRSSRPTSSGFHRPVLRIAAVAVVAGLLTGSSGCDGPFGDPDLRLDVPPERLREIDTLRLEEAPAAPVDVDTESAASARALLEP